MAGYRPRQLAKKVEGTVLKLTEGSDQTGTARRVVGGVDRQRRWAEHGDEVDAGCFRAPGSPRIDAVCFCRGVQGVSVAGGSLAASNRGGAETHRWCCSKRIFTLQGSEPGKEHAGGLLEARRRKASARWSKVLRLCWGCKGRL